MNITVLGCGAMGSIYAALLSSNGNDVTVVDPNAEHIAAIKNNGLRVYGASGDRTVKVNAYLTPPSETCDLLVIAVKGSHVASAVAGAHSLINERSLILTIQNGLGSSDVVASVLGKEQLLVGIAQGFGASLPEPGQAHHNDMKAIRMGAYAGLDTEAVLRVANCFKAAGFDAEAADDIEAMQWQKLICNVAYSAISALTGFTVGEIMDDPQVGPVSQLAAVEAWEIGKAKGVAMQTEDPVQMVRDFAARMPDAKPSVLLDIEAGRLSEVVFINGAIPLEAQKLGLAAPVNQTLTGLVHSLELSGSFN
jgi:2-dehydropantoate 2-reductase